MNMALDFLEYIYNELGMEPVLLNRNNITLKTLSIEYTRGYKIKGNFHFEFGAKALFGFENKKTKSNDINVFKDKTQMLTFTVPVNFGYQIKLGNKIGLTPYAGLNMKVHAMSRTRYTKSFKYAHMSSYTNYSDSGWINPYDYKDSHYTRVQAGWQVGLSLSIHNFYMGGCYGTDFVSLCREKMDNNKTARVNSSSFSVSTGIYF